MEKIITIAERFYEFVVTTLFGEITGNEWYTAHLDVIQGATTVVLVGVALLLAFALIAAMARFLASIFDIRGRR